MNQQEIFNKVATHLLTQGVCSQSSIGQCMYRNGGLMCAVGCLIPNELYNPRIEGGTASSLCDTAVLRLWYSTSEIDAIQAMGFVQANAGLLDDLQSVHDVAAPKTWAKCLEQVAKNYGLSSEVLCALQQR